MTVLTRPSVATSARLSFTVVLRVWCWRAIWWLCGGLTVRGQAPASAAVVIANHRSHADSAALIAALSARQPVWLAAAADYWFCSRRKRALGVLIPSLPLQRQGSGAYLALRAAAAPVIARGGIVVIYPEGTRGSAGEPGQFRAGAAHLAGDLGVPLVPTAIAGTDQILPKGGRFHRAPAAVAFGAPLVGAEIPTDATILRSTVAALLPAARVREPHPLYAAVARRIAGSKGAALAFCWGFAEALVWPLLAEMSLILFAVTVPRKVVRQAVFLALGSVVGVVVHAWLAAHGVTLPLLLTTPRMAEAASADLASGPWGITQQAVSGIPVKVYAAEAGAAGLPLAPLALAAALERGARILVVGAGVAVAAWLGRPLVQRYYPTYLVIASVVFVYALGRVIASWA